MRRRLIRFRRSTRGTAAIEFALVLPVMLLLMGGIVEFGSILRVYNQLNRLATQYAIAWADCKDGTSSACSAELGLYTSPSAITNIAPNLDPSQLSVQMFQLDMAAPSGSAVVYAYPSGATPKADQMAAATGAAATGKLVLVSVRYTHALLFFPSLLTNALSAQLHPAYTVVQLKS